MITIHSTDEELMQEFESNRRQGNGEQAGRDTDTSARAARREGWKVIREIPTHHNPSKCNVLAQDAAGGLWIIEGQWAIQVAQ